VPTSILFEVGVGYTLSFRSDRIYESAKIKVLADGDVIKTAKKRIIVPSEMEQIGFTLDRLPSEISIAIEEE